MEKSFKYVSEPILERNFMNVLIVVTPLEIPHQIHRGELCVSVCVFKKVL